MNPLRSVGAKLSLALAAIVAGALAIVYLIVVPSLERNLVDAKRTQLRRALPGVVRQLPNSPYLWQDFAQTAAESTNARVVLLDTLYEGPPVTLTTSADSNLVESTDVERDPIAIKAATRLERVEGTTVRHGQRYAEVAAPVARDGPVLLLSAPLRDSLRSVHLVQRRLLLAGLGALAVAAGLGLLGSLVFTRRIRRLERAADRIAGGEFGEPVHDASEDELGQLAGAFDRMRLRLARLEHARREFIANASHELRTPIFSLSGFLELLTDEELDEATRREFLLTMREQIERLTRLATDLLDLSRLDAGRIHVERQSLDLGTLAEALVEEFSPAARARGHELSAVVSVDAAAAADEERVRQIGGILLENALVHTPPGTTVRVRARTQNSRAELTVEDDGPGIAPELTERVFERFSRGDGSIASGSGLGLAIARELAELMDGSVELTSRLGRTAFTLSLPSSTAEPAFSRENAEVLV
jgi:two-component system, OmpR family, sensor kinase